MTLILGINAYHGDSAACVLADGKLVAAVEEERFRRIKHWAGLPTRAIAFCLREANARLQDVDHLAVNSDPGASLWRKLAFLVTSRPDARLVFDRIRHRRQRESIREALAQGLEGQRFTGRIHRVEHHRAHLASGFLVSPFQEAAVVSVDGFGDFSSAAWGTGRSSTIRIDGRVHFPHSLGVFYETLTRYMGFRRYGDEYKIMGLAPYGEPRYIVEMRDIVKLRGDGGYALNLEYFSHHRRRVNFQWHDCEPVGDDFYTPALSELLGPPRGDGETLT